MFNLIYDYGNTFIWLQLLKAWNFTACERFCRFFPEPQRSMDDGTDYDNQRTGEVSSITWNNNM